MKATYTSPDTRLSIEFDGASVKEVFESLATIQEAFEEKSCGCCNKSNIRCDVRTAQNYKYFQIVCLDCSARLDLGQSKDLVRLFAKRDEHPETRGWYVYSGTNGNGHNHAEPRANDRFGSNPTDPKRISESVEADYTRRLKDSTTPSEVEALATQLSKVDHKKLTPDGVKRMQALVGSERERVKKLSNDIPF